MAGVKRLVKATGVGCTPIEASLLSLTGKFLDRRRIEKEKTAWIYIYFVRQVLGASILAFPNSSRF